MIKLIGSILLLWALAVGSFFAFNETIYTYNQQIWISIVVVYTVVLGTVLIFKE